MIENVLASRYASPEMIEVWDPASKVRLERELWVTVMEIQRDLGLSIPEDVSVVGFDNIELSSFVSPRLTTIAQPIEEMGNLAVELLHSMITGKEKSRTDILLPFTLIERESTAQLR